MFHGNVSNETLGSLERSIFIRIKHEYKETTQLNYPSEFVDRLYAMCVFYGKKPIQLNQLNAI